MVGSVVRFLDNKKHKVKAMLLAGIHLHHRAQSKDMFQATVMIAVQRL
jgi:hypothetical protein